MEKTKEESTDNNGLKTIGKLERQKIIRIIVIVLLIIFITLGSYLIILVINEPDVEIEIKGFYITDGFQINENVYYEPMSSEYHILIVFNLTIEVTSTILPGVDLFNPHSIDVGAYHFSLQYDSKTVRLDPVHLLHHKTKSNLNLLNPNHPLRVGEKISCTMVFPYYENMQPIALILDAPRHYEKVNI